jgi:hypothetical protein
VIWLLFPVFALNVCAQDSAAAGWLLDMIWFDEIATKKVGNSFGSRVKFSYLQIYRMA